MGTVRRLAVAAWVLGLSGLALAAACVVGVRAGYQANTVASDSMAPTYAAGDRVVFERIGGEEVRRGDVVVYAAPERYGFDAGVMGRVVAVGGDHVVCCTGQGAKERITVNGRPLDEPYVKDGVVDGLHRPYDVHVPEGRMFVLGDHRVNSRDSRFFAGDHGGTVPVEAVRGRATDNWTVPVLLGVAALLGLVAALAGLGLAIAAVAVRRRRAASAPPWPVRA
ncbi:signal peptidase I [Streptomyces sp. TRM68367]|uniref:signal peptidase I n=1 Tax=Streptomyces sp. TRM68367 TaxID=2758415 RepID=UPI00165AA262|nr:signal peptidase I [Streptomyces sp. TRM68367]MBC9728608.1 signal peptidase I [Streptomyces sp. TRM68367]